MSMANSIDGGSTGALSAERLGSSPKARSFSGERSSMDGKGVVDGCL